MTNALATHKYLYHSEFPWNHCHMCMHSSSRNRCIFRLHMGYWYIRRHLKQNNENEMYQLVCPQICKSDKEQYLSSSPLLYTSFVIHTILRDMLLNLHFIEESSGHFSLTFMCFIFRHAFQHEQFSNFIPSNNWCHRLPIHSLTILVFSGKLNLMELWKDKVM